MKNNPTELIADLKVIRTIHSNKALQFGSYNFWYLIITIIVAVIVTFIGFYGAENFVKLVSKKDTISYEQTNSKSTAVNKDQVLMTQIDSLSKKNVPLNYNILEYSEKEDTAKAKIILDLMTLSILVISILGLILKFESKTNKHNSAVIRLTEFVSDVEFNYLSTATPTTFRADEIQIYAEKYKSLINSLPATKDKDYIHALKTIKRKKKIKTFIESEVYDNQNVFTRKWTILWM
jgi:hypothetical protein